MKNMDRGTLDPMERVCELLIAVGRKYEKLGREDQEWLEKVLENLIDEPISGW